MLDDRQLPDDLSLEHLHEAFRYLLTVGEGTYIVQNGGALAERDPFLYLVDERDAAEINEVVRFFAQRGLTVNGIRGVPLVILDQLASSKQESWMLVVVEAPDTVRPSWLHHINELDLPHQGEVTLDNLVDQGLEILLLVDLQLNKAEEEDNEVQLMPSPIIDSLIGSKGLSQVHLHSGIDSLIGTIASSIESTF
jgi:hypothetical protein